MPLVDVLKAAASQLIVPRLPERWPAASWVSSLARISYSVFLVQFPVCMLINAAVFRFFQADLTANVLGLLIAWSASIGAGWLLYCLVERRSDRLVAARYLRTRTAVAAS